MNVDDLLRVSLHELVREDLHVACEDNEIHLMALEHGKHLLLGRSLVVLLYGDEEKRNVVKVGDALAVLMIGNDAGNLARQFPALVPIEQIHQTVIVFRNENRHARAGIGESKPPVKVEFSRNGCEPQTEGAKRVA